MTEQALNEPIATFEELLTVDQVAKVTTVSVGSVWRLTKAGKLPQPIKIGRSVRWRSSDIQEFLSRAAQK